MYCRKCGKELDEDWNQCPYCNAEIRTVNKDGKKGLKKKRIVIIFSGFIIFFILLCFLIPKEDVKNSQKEADEIKEIEEIIDLSSIDMESMIGKTKEQMEDEGFVIPEDDIMAYNGETAVRYDEEGIVDLIIIEGDKELAPTFHTVALGDGKEDAAKKLEDTYDYFEDLDELGFSRVNMDTGESVTCLCENEEVDKITFRILSEEELQELKSEIEEENNAGTYIFPDSNKRYLSEAEVRSVSVDQMLIGRNEIFARHGRMFDTPELTEYFSQQPWYQGTIPAAQFDSSVLNDFEKKNVELIKRIEDEINGVSTSSGFNPNEYTDLVSLWGMGNIPSSGTKVSIYGWITGHTGGTIFFKPHQMVPDLLIYYDSSKYTPIDGTEAVVYGTFGGVLVGDTYCMDGYYFENLN